MSKILICDRCDQRIESSPGEESSIQIPGFPIPIGHVSRTEMACREVQTIDLCMECYKALRVWWMNPVKG